MLINIEPDVHYNVLILTWLISLLRVPGIQAVVSPPVDIRKQKRKETAY